MYLFLVAGNDMTLDQSIRGMNITALPFFFFSSTPNYENQQHKNKIKARGTLLDKLQHRSHNCTRTLYVPGRLQSVFADKGRISPCGVFGNLCFFISSGFPTVGCLLNGLIMTHPALSGQTAQKTIFSSFPHCRAHVIA